MLQKKTGQGINQTAHESDRTSRDKNPPSFATVAFRHARRALGQLSRFPSSNAAAHHSHSLPLKLAPTNPDSPYRTLVASMDEAFAVIELVYDGDGHCKDFRYLEVNDAFEHHTGLTQPVGRTMREMVPALSSYWAATYAKVVESGVPVRFEHKGTGNRWFDVNAIRLEPAESCRVVLQFKNITAKKREEQNTRFLADITAELSRQATVEEILCVAGEQIRRFLDVSSVSFAEIDDASCEATIIHHAQSDDDTRNLGIYRLDDSLTSDSIGRLRRGETVAIDGLASRSSVRHGNHCLPFGAGSLIAPSLSSSGTLSFLMAAQHCPPRQWHDDEIALIKELSTRTWLTMQRARAEEALRASNQRIVEAMRAARMAAWEWDPRRKELVFSDAVSSILGLLPGQAAGSVDSAMQRIHPDDRERCRQLVDEHIQRGCGWSQEFRVIRPVDDLVVWLEERATVCCDNTTGELQCSGLLWDITARKQAEAELHALNTTLERRVDERTNQVRALALRLSRAEQEERLRISHILHDDLQQLLCAAQMKMDTIKTSLRRDDPHGLEADIEKVEDWIFAATATTRQLALDLSPPVLRQQGFVAALHWLQHQMQTMHGLGIEIDVQDSYLDPDEHLGSLLFQVIRELLFNVRKHASVEHAMLSVMREDDQLLITVRDMGRGFDPSALNRPESSTKFGLLSARERLRMIGGDIDIASAPSRGSRFTIRVPQVRPPQQDTSHP